MNMAAGKTVAWWSDCFGIMMVDGQVYDLPNGRISFSYAQSEEHENYSAYLMTVHKDDTLLMCPIDGTLDIDYDSKEGIHFCSYCDYKFPRE